MASGAGNGSNGLGINSFSGPMGEKEPAYGTAETMKVLGRIGVKPPVSVGAPQRAKRAAVNKTKAQAEPPPGPVVTTSDALAGNYQGDLSAFWQQLAADPGASPLVRQYAAQVS